jgi:hypothetical protein
MLSTFEPPPPIHDYSSIPPSSRQLPDDLLPRWRDAGRPRGPAPADRDEAVVAVPDAAARERRLLGLWLRAGALGDRPRRRVRRGLRRGLRREPRRGPRRRAARAAARGRGQPRALDAPAPARRRVVGRDGEGARVGRLGAACEPGALGRGRVRRRRRGAGGQGVGARELGLFFIYKIEFLGRRSAHRPLFKIVFFLSLSLFFFIFSLSAPSRR